MGCLYGVGVGPGDPELLTLKARRVLTEVPVIFVPKKAEENESIAESIISGLALHFESKLVRIVLPMLRNKHKLQEYRQRAADMIWQHLELGQDGAFINVGDPLFYGSFIHVVKVLQSSHPETKIEIVPGVSSINAAAARAVVPLASDDENIAVLSGDQKTETIRNALEKFDTVVFMKVNTIFDRLLGILEEMNLKDKSIYVRRCTTEAEEIVRDIGRLQGDKLDYFSLLIVRK
ncbi:MAG: precorrin-2 C(20)-methyltransferase [Chloroflexi bacterium RBG_16_50_9]|nr:MAG: precorrin-2 C(20)-methyltransferase [Chloroflexi bacterium RBG_16_50_9]